MNEIATSEDELQWTDAQYLLAVAEGGSFGAAADRLSVGQPTVSRHIAQMEQRLGVQLFVRGRHGATATLAAERMLTPALQMARWAKEFQRSAAAFEQTPAGKIVLAAPPGIAADYLAPLAKLLAHELPGIQLEVRAGIDRVDLARGEADIAVRTLPPSEPDIAVLCHAKVPMGVFATAEYASTLRPPCDWGELDWITWSGAYRTVAPRPMLEKVIDDFSPAFSADDYLVLVSAVHQGLGAMIMGAPLPIAQLRKPGGYAQPTLTEIAMQNQLPPMDLYVVCAKSMRTVPRIAAVAKLLVEQIEQLLPTNGP